MPGLSKTISAIVPTFNRSQMLRECLDSILAQTRPVDEIIVVNDGSTDDTESVIKTYGNRLKTINKTNGGKSSALNAALELCKSDYIWICDDDDIAASDGLEHLAKALDADDTIGFVHGAFSAFHDDNAGRHHSTSIDWRRKDEPNNKIQFLEGNFTYQFAMLVRRSLYLKIGGFREDMIRSQDYDMAIRLSQQSKDGYVPNVIFFHRNHDGMRGAASDRFSAGMQKQTWLAYDQQLFSRLRNELPLDSFAPTFALDWDKELYSRAALIERGCVFANHAMWNEAVSDFKEASKASVAPITPQELKLMETVISNCLAWDALMKNNAWRTEIRTCYKSSQFGHCIIMAACRHFVWRARLLCRGNDISEGIKQLQMLVALIGLRGAFMRILLSVLN